MDKGYGKRQATRFHVVAVDYGIKRNILRLLNDCGCAVTVVPATASAEDILALKPDGVFLSNGPGDPAATGEYAVPTIQALLETKTPLFGICLGHQLLGLAVGGRTVKMPQGHHGANHPVKDFTTGKVEIVSMNHGFAVDRASLPANAEETHVSLFDGSNCGIALSDRPAFSVQYHPEASPGPRDSHYLFRRFVDLIAARRRPSLDWLTRPHSRALEGGGEAFGLGEVVQSLLVVQNVDDFDPRAPPADLQAKKRAHSRVTKLHVDLDDRRRVPRRREARGKRVTQRSALEEEFRRGIDEIGDIGGMVVLDQQYEFRRVAEPQFAGDVRQRIGDDLLARAGTARPRAALRRICCFGQESPSSANCREHLRVETYPRL